MVLGTSGCQVMTRKQLFTYVMNSEGYNFGEKLENLETYLFNFGPFSDKDTENFRRDVRRIKSDLKTRFTISRYRKEFFEKQNEKWLDGKINIPKPLSPPTGSGPGRPKKLFQNLTERNKRRRTEELRKTIDLDVLTYATQSKLATEGKRDAAFVLKESISTPKRATKYKKAFSNSQTEKKSKQLTSREALSMFIEADLSTRQYNIIRGYIPNMLPCYDKIQEAKKECYPQQDSITVTETSAEIKLQALMDHTASRLLTDLEELLSSLNENERSSLVLLSKWGCDGAQQAQFKQKFISDSNLSDGNLFQSSFVPLRLLCSTNNKVVWQNPTPSSPRYCRPIRLRFIKETADVTREEIEHIQDAANNLEKTAVVKNEITYKVSHIMMLTMIDGKVCNSATNTTSTMRCYICGLTSKDFNSSLETTLPVKDGTLDFGLSILHARIRFFEAILHLAYKAPVKKWQLRSKEEKARVQERKKEIQEEFHRKTGLIVDVPKANFGNTNDGNTSRRFFADHELASEITGIDVNLIYRFKIILEVLSSGLEINVEQFSVYAKETAKLYVDLYGWHPMTPTLHKILIHGPQVIEKALLPIGQLSEEAAEARNKYIRQYRQNFARKFTRTECNVDILNRLLINSDPLMTGMRPPSNRRTSEPFSKETISMLQCPQSLETPINALHDFISSDEE